MSQGMISFDNTKAGWASQEVFRMVDLLQNTSMLLTVGGCLLNTVNMDDETTDIFNKYVDWGSDTAIGYELALCASMHAGGTCKQYSTTYSTRLYPYIHRLNVFSILLHKIWTISPLNFGVITGCTPAAVSRCIRDLTVKFSHGHIERYLIASSSE